jgi:hypothetical protein
MRVAADVRQDACGDFLAKIFFARLDRMSRPDRAPSRNAVLKSDCAAA